MATTRSRSDPPCSDSQRSSSSAEETGTARETSSGLMAQASVPPRPGSNRVAQYPGPSGNEVERRANVTPMISSYARDAWHTATDEGVTVRDASTGEPVARVSRTGGAVVGIAEDRRRGGRWRHGRASGAGGGAGAGRAYLPPAGRGPGAAGRLPARAPRRAVRA